MTTLLRLRLKQLDITPNSFIISLARELGLSKRKTYNLQHYFLKALREKSPVSGEVYEQLKAHLLKKTGDNLEDFVDISRITFK